MSSKIMQAGGLIWVTGYSGAGKSTVARIVSEELKSKGLPVLFLDGDDLRSILGEKFGHDLDERKRLAYVYSRLCKRICDNGITVVIATVAMFESVRAENRLSNLFYLEAYLDVPLDIRAERDPKGIYLAAKATGNILSTSVGFEEPSNPDIIVKNFGKTTPQIAATEIIEKFMNTLPLADAVSLPIPASYNERAKYWDSYYKKRVAPTPPSSFAIFCNENHFGNHCHVLEFGCGNGRDSFYFSKKHRITAIDQSVVATNTNKQRARDEGILNIDFVDGEFGKKTSGMPAVVDVVYGRFVMHAMSLEDEIQALNYSYQVLKPEGKIYLEFRTDKDRLMNDGVIVGLNERLTDHYRRFINLDDFCERLAQIGFAIDYCLERSGLAKHGDDDPTVARVIARKIT
ncbi:Adenylylsulfate kinase [Pseudomonas arsenicoxydans]|uniref:Adenylylsulfate kinase n=1 Tax=Pseudomonas arsenicoxydans TaxID=702115 RepID=A0A1H0RYX1_9PSED|nr:adenylyl-sulfate kinase [Pseudomonas arsenicoxydans]SDP34633.1 Adenylylsulfate kinase [Pseudomonas arsenicoxydans]